MATHPFYIKSYCIIRPHTVVLDGEVCYKAPVEAPLSEWFKALYKHFQLDYPKFHKMDTLCKAIFLAAELISSKNRLQGSDTALVFSNFSSSYVSDEKHAAGIFNSENPLASPAIFVYTLPNIAMGEISIRHQLHSENVFFIFDTFTPGFLVPYNDGVLQNQRADGVLSGWVEVGKNDRCDVFVYLLDRAGDIPHTESNLTKLYTQDYE